MDISPSDVQGQSILTNVQKLDPTTQDYQRASICPRMAAALEDSLHSGDEIEIDASAFSGAQAAPPVGSPPAALLTFNHRDGLSHH